MWLTTPPCQAILVLLIGLAFLKSSPHGFRRRPQIPTLRLAHQRQSFDLTEFIFALNRKIHYPLLETTIAWKVLSCTPQ